MSYMIVSSNIYVFDTFDVVGRDTNAYMYMYIKWIPHAAAPLLSSTLGWYDPQNNDVSITYFHFNTRSIL